MIVYNITVKIDWAISDEWLLWQQQEHIPEILATHLFDAHKIFRLLDQDDSEGPTFTIQYFTSSIEKYQQYINEFAPALRQKAFSKWGDRFISFHTLMQVVS
jgi:uncharacterized protein DUF4286